MQVIKIKEILGIDVAISDIQANEVKKNIDFSKEVILDFEGISDATTAFINIIFDGFYDKLINPLDLIKKLKIKNSNDSIKFAFGDAFSLFKARFEK